MFCLPKNISIPNFNFYIGPSPYVSREDPGLNRSVIDQPIHLESPIRNPFSKMEHLTAVFFDKEKSL